ncbi:MAG TPA: prenyltransferase/squalene oxidase repeat-containing protein [Planctomycetota bacterium]|nr:prenyltransferase/squalene oxidase repeat-containing protein [Planctomycetota bacterium]
MNSPDRPLLPALLPGIGPPSVDPQTREAESDWEPDVEKPEEDPDPDGWKRSFTARSLVWLAKHQNEDGSWGDGPALLEGQYLGRAGITSLVLLSLIHAGYTQLSKDVYDGTPMGHSVLRALIYLLKDQQQDGTFESSQGGLDQALVALALSEGYGVTASGYLKDPAAKALDALVRSQFPDGSWGPPATSVAALHALYSGELSELPIDNDVRARALQYAGTCPHPGMLGARILMTKQRGEQEGAAAAAFAEAPPPPDDFAGWLHASTGVYLASGPEGRLWKEWSGSMREMTGRTRARDGSWPAGTGSATIVRTSLALQMEELLYRYSTISK